MPNNLEDLFGRFQGFVGLGNLGAGGEQSPRNGRVIPFVAMPAMLRTVERPGERIAAVLAFKDVDGGVVGDKIADHIDIAVPGGKVERGVTCVHSGVGRPTRGKQKMERSGCCCVWPRR